ncbi:MAG: hypothetical protein NTX85_03025 [Candidatus Nomurabacteria bacterium]|nr:hypothetical protein [Candidatus Nomurabacteria bacterium]
MKNLKFLSHYSNQIIIWLKYNGPIIFAIPMYLVFAILVNKGVLPNFPKSTSETLLMSFLIFIPLIGFSFGLCNHWKYNGWQKFKC